MPYSLIVYVLDMLLSYIGAACTALRARKTGRPILHEGWSEGSWPEIIYIYIYIMYVTGKHLTLCAHFVGSCSDSGRGGVGFTLLLSFADRVWEIYSCRMNLGLHCSSELAHYQACGSTLLAVFSLLTWLTECRGSGTTTCM